MPPGSSAAVAHGLPWLAAADLVNLSLALSMGGYLLWFFRRRPERRDALWAAAISFSSALYTACVGSTYMLPSTEGAPFRVTLSFLAVALMVNSLLGFASAVAARPIPYFRFIALGGIALWGVLLLGTSWVVPNTIDPIQLSWHSRPYPQPAATPLSSLFFLYCIVTSSFGAWWLYRHSSGSQMSWRVFVFGFSIWIAAGVHDSLLSMRILQNPALYLLEYGFLAFALLVFGHQQREHVDLIDRQQRALASSAQSFQELIEQSPEIIGVHRHERFVYLNRHGAESLGYENANELVGMSTAEVMKSDDLGLVPKDLGAVFEGLATSEPRAMRLQRADGTSLTCEVISMPVRFEGLASVLVMARDLSGRQRLEARMMQMDRMISIGTLAAGVTHEINNPLTFVIANLSMISDSNIDLQKLMPPKDPLREHTESIASCVEDAIAGSRRIRDIVRDLSTLSRKRQRQEAAVDLPATLESAVKLAWNELRHRCKLVREIENVESIVGDDGRLGQVVINLLVNAAQALPLGHADDNTIFLRAFMREDKVAIEVEDTGTGIDPALLPRIFEPFMTTKPVGSGTGMGLAICRQIVDEHGGEIQVESELGKGSCFRILLPPMVADPEFVDVDEIAKPEQESHQRGRILLIDDEKLLLRILARKLRKAHHEANTAGTATEALQMLKDNPAYDLILCDLMMPNMSGIEFHGILQERWPELLPKLVIMSGGAFTPEAREFLQKVENPLLEKPFEPEVLMKMVDGFLARG
ncbi:MAG: response regulator [Deltaproteobacteria bacterium]|nr:response regulator [Deltaproteobacteria bacterium]